MLNLTTSELAFIIDYLIKHPFLRNVFKLNIPFYKEMLYWPAGSRESDGIWGQHWYGSVEASTGFHPYIQKKRGLPSKYRDIYTVCMGNYEKLYSYRLQ